MILDLKKSSEPSKFQAHALFGLVLLILCPPPANALDALDAWRGSVAAARMLAENDVQQAYAQAVSLQKNMPPAALPADRAKVLNLLSRAEVYGALTESAQRHAELALDIARQADDRPGQAEAQLNIALNAVNQARIDASVAATTRSVELLDGVDRPDLLGEALLRMSMMYRRLSDFDNSVTMAMQSMEIARRSKDPMALTYVYQGIAISFEQSGHPQEALDNYRKMREQARSAHSKMLEAHAVAGMAVTMRQLGNAQDSERLMRSAVGMFRSIHAPFSLNFGLFGLADTLSGQGKYQQALSALDEVVANYGKYPNPIGLWYTLNARSRDLQALHRIDEAGAEANKAYALAEKINLSVYLGASARRLSEIHAAQGDYRRAYRYAAEAAEMADKTEHQKSSARMVELAQRYETDSKQRLIDELKRRNEQQGAHQRWLWTVLLSSAALLVLTSFFLVRLRRSRREIEQLNIGLEQRVQERTDELRQQSRYLRTLFDTLPISVWLKDTAGRYLTINTCQIASDRISAEQMIGKTDEEIWPGELGAAFRAVDIEVMSARQRKTQELAIPDCSGEIFWREIDKAPVIDEDGTLLGTVGVGRDISERKRYEQSLLAQTKLEQRLSSVASNIPGFIFTFRAEPDGKISLPFASPGIEEMFGLTTEQARLDAWALRARYHPDDLPRVIMLMEKSRQALTPFDIEMRMYNRDDQLRWIAIHSIPQRQGDGSTEWNGIVLDITERKRIEETLRLSQESLAEAQRIAHVGSWQMNLVDNVLEWSDEIYRIFEIDPQQFGASYEAFMSLVHPDDRDTLDRAYKASLERRERFEIEHRLLLTDGRIKHVHERGENYYDGNGKPLRSLGTVQDITARKTMERALYESEARYRNNYNVLQSMLESSSSVSVFALDRDYRYLFFNKRHKEGAKRIRGTDIFIGMNMLESIGNDEFRAFCRKGFDLVLEGQSVSVESKEEVVTDGIGCCEYNENHGSPIFDDDGKVVGLTVFSINITERKRLEAELNASRNFLDSVIDSVSEPIFVKDRQHRWTLLNDAFCAFIGKPRDALIGKSDYDFFPKEQADVFWEKDELVFESGTSNLNEEHFTSASGEEHYIQTRKAPFVAGDGRQMLVGIIRDITELKRYETARDAALIEAERLVRSRSEFIAQMSHELRTPLNGILGYAQLFGRDKRLDQRQLACIKVIRECGEHLLSLINDILDFAKIDAGKIEIDAADIQPDRFLQKIARMMRIKAEEKHLEFICTLAPDIPAWIHADEKRLRQVLFNLLSNAIKFTEQGRVSLRVEMSPAGYLRFEVSDTGIGIEADQLDMIFQPFEQVGDRRSRHGGTGLGLPISRQFVRLMGGDIRVDSTPGQGSVFWFELDLAGDAPAMVDAYPMRAVTGYLGARKTVLVADDVLENRAVVVQMLGELGFETVEGEDGADVLDKVRCMPIDLILMDSLMPAMDGLEATRRLRRLPGCEALPVIAMSASADTRNEAQCVEAGANAFLPKPLDMTALLAQIAGLLRLEWLYEQHAPAAPLLPPSQEEMRILHGHALIGNMRDIMQCCDRIAGSDPRCRPFTEHLRALASEYQSRAVLSLVEQYLESRGES